ncbi:dihydrodipicolinate synthase family protein [Kallotenue papyrolyticum]|uniref:dihydrodipicolinate synthase family protein n=1 Tax=Kallotenue papyrolyticum TaxID=1325125 RepID=UPI000492271C|nr:dihydrodipicolinate synthase family protein [Kallotenue papyrolyticum]
MQELHGVFVAAVTPFDARGVFQPAWQADHFAWLQEQGVDGVLVAGTNGEGPSLSIEERRAVIDAAVKHRGRLRLIAGTGTPSLSETIALSRYACEAGVDAVLIVPPYYFRDVPTAGLVRYYRAVCDALPAHGRMLFYHIPRVSGVPIDHELIAEVRRSHPQQCYGIKDTGGDAEATARLVQAFPALHVLGGSDHLMAANLQAGVRGQISGLANAFPELFVALWQAYRDGEPVIQFQQQIAAIQSVVKRYPLHAATKALAAWRAGLSPINVKPPLLELEPEQRALLHRAIAELGML